MRELVFQSQPSNEPPFVSLLVPAFNVEKYLDEALKSAETAKSCPLEIIVIDDGSDDGTLKIAEKHADADSRIKILHQENAGYGAALNAGIALARGTFIAILEPDDYLAPHALDQLFDFLRNAPAIDALNYPDIVKATYYRVFSRDEEGPNKREKAKKKTDSTEIENAKDPHNSKTTEGNSNKTSNKRGKREAEAKMLCSYAHLFKTGTYLNRAERADLLTRHPSIWSALYRRSFLAEKHIKFKEAPGAAWVDGPFAVQTFLEAKEVLFYDAPIYNYREDNPQASSAKDISAFAPERFSEMIQIQETLSPHDKEMRQALVVVGLNYFDRIVSSEDPFKPNVSEKITNMMAFLEPEEIKRAHQIAPHVREEALKFQGHRRGRISGFSYYQYVLKRAFFELRNNGIGATFTQMKQFRKRGK